MKPIGSAIFTVMAAAVLMAGSAYALEIDCPPELAAGARTVAAQGSDGLTLDEEMLKKRKKAREEEMARLKARYLTRTGSTAQIEPTEQAPTAR